MNVTLDGNSRLSVSATFLVRKVRNVYFHETLFFFAFFLQPCIVLAQRLNHLFRSSFHTGNVAVVLPVEYHKERRHMMSAGFRRASTLFGP